MCRDPTARLLGCRKVRGKGFEQSRDDEPASYLRKCLRQAGAHSPESATPILSLYLCNGVFTDHVIFSIILN